MVLLRSVYLSLSKQFNLIRIEEQLWPATDEVE